MMKIKAFIFVAILSNVALGQSVEDTVKIPEVIVRPSIELESNKVEVDSTQIMNPVHANLGELLQQNSSAFVRSYGIGSTATISFRGAASSHSQLLWNGIALNSSTNGVVDFALFPTELLGNVSISEGISSLQNNSGALGGSVLLSPEKNLTEGLSVSHSIGSFGWQRSHLKLVSKFKKWSSHSQLFYTSVNNNFEYTDFGSPIFESGTITYPEKELENAKLEQFGLKQDFGFQLNENNALGLELWYFDSFRQLPNVLTVNNAQEEQEDRSIRIQLNGKHYFKKSNLKWVTTVIEDEILYQNFSNDLISFSENQSWRSFLDYELKIDKNTLWSNRLNIDVDRAINDGFDLEQNQNRLSYFTDLKYLLNNKFKVDLGGRIEYITQNEFFAMPFASLTFKRKRYELKLNGGRNVKYPNLNDLYWIPGGNPELEVEKSLSTDLTLNSKWVEKDELKITSSLTLFYNHIDNYILWKPTRFGYWQAENIKAVYSRGLQVNYDLKHIGKLKKHISFNYSLTQSRSLNQINQYDRSKNKQLIYLPEHQVASFLNIEWKTINLNLNYQFFSTRYTTSDHSQNNLPYYQVVDATIGKVFQLKKSKLNLSFAIQNLLNEEYQAVAWRPMPGRNYLLKLAYGLPQ